MGERTSERVHHVTTESGHRYRFVGSTTRCTGSEVPDVLSDRNYEVLRDFLSCHPDFVYFLDREHRFLYANASLLALWGLDLGDVVGRTFTDLGYPDDLVELHRTQLDLAFAGKTVRGENGFTAEDGSEGYYEYIFVPLDATGERVTTVAGVTRDITRRKQLEDQREFLLAALAHDLRTPLSVVESGAAILAETSEEATAQTLADRLRRNAGRASKIIDLLLDASRTRWSGELDLRRERVRLDETVVRTAEQLQPLHDGPIEAEVEGDGDDGFLAQWDEEAIQRILENLVGNAVKHGDPSRPIRVHLERRGDDAVLSVHNHGEPIPEEDRESLFELFARGTTETRTGWGIGLTVVANLVDRHDGEVAVSSGAREGTTFTITLPILD